jgi:hypothetical protein
MDAASGEFEGEGSGSGVIISPEGLVLTARHVVFHKNAPAREVWAGLVDGRNPRLPPARVKRMKILAEDAALDLALLRIEPKRGGDGAERFPFLRLALDDDLVFGSSLSVVGFPAAGGATTTVTSVNVVGFDARQGWIKVEGAVMQGASGGAAVNERGDLVGIASQVAADRVLLFGDEDLPVGTLTLGKVGFIREAEKIRGFLRRHRTLTASALSASSPSLLVAGNVRDAGTGRSLANASVGVISPRAAAPESYVAPGEWLAVGRTSATGEFTLNRALKPGNYLVKIVHPDYKPLFRRVDIGKDQQTLDIRLKRE